MKLSKTKQKTPRQKQIDKLDKMASEIVRKRAVQLAGGCERCNLILMNGKHHDWKELQAAHCVGRSIFNTRWNLDNIAGLCGGCHMFIDRDNEAKDELFTRLLGEKGLLYLKAQKKFKGKTDMDLIEIYLREQIKLQEIE